MVYKIHFMAMRREIYSVIVPADNIDEAATNFENGKFNLGEALLEKTEKMKDWKLILLDVDLISNDFLDELKRQI